ncbi:MAG: alpha-L-fucosidase [Bacteroides sp.]
MKTNTLLITLLLALPLSARAQYVHQRSSGYDTPDDPQVVAKLHQWQDQKFGMLIHWGLYAVPGIVESWNICSEEQDFISRDSTADYNEYKKQYWALKEQFNPTQFNPEQWAQTAKEAGMRYVIFTTKHHDGFNMFNTAYSDFSIAKGPFGTNPRADVAKYVFQAFRNQQMMIGAYYSKPDWHSPYYWWPRYATPGREHNYNIDRNRWRWNQFNEFVYNQLDELMHNYGSIDILWLDGGWVNATGSKAQLDMPRMAAMARKAQPGLLMVDRTIHGKYENYQTPEQQIPAKQLSYPWETCMTLGTDWGYNPHAVFKSPAVIVGKLIEIVAKGGSLVLGIGPTPEGILQKEVVAHLQTIGQWMKLNGKAIYNTLPTSCYESNGTWFTADKDGKTLYALHSLPQEGKMPAFIEWEKNLPLKGSAMYCLQNGKRVKWLLKDGRVRVYPPAQIKTEIRALTFSFVPTGK